MTTAYLDNAISSELGNLSSTTAGRNKQLFISAASLYRFAEAGVISDDELTDRLENAGSAAGLGRDEIRATLKSARRRAGNLDHADAAAIREKCNGTRRSEYTPAERAPRAPEACEPPCKEWRAAGAAFVAFSQGELSKHRAPADYLHSRGLTDHTIARFGLGYNPAGRWSERAKWGIARDDDPRSSYPEHIWLPQGIVIPEYFGGDLWKIEIRQDSPRDPAKRYKTITNSANVLAGADSIQPGKPAMLVEGPIDWLAVAQAAGDLIGVGRVGTSGAHRVRWITLLALCSEVLVSLDADAAGDEASPYWIDALPNARRYRPAYADPAQVLQDGGDLRAWVQAGLRNEPRATVKPIHPEFVGFWQLCLARQNSHVDRLRQLCAAGGYDYEATVAWIDAQPMDADAAAILDKDVARAA